MVDVLILPENQHSEVRFKVPDVKSSDPIVEAHISFGKVDTGAIVLSRQTVAAPNAEGGVDPHYADNFVVVYFRLSDEDTRRLAVEGKELFYCVMCKTLQGKTFYPVARGLTRIVHTLV